MGSIKKLLLLGGNRYNVAGIRSASEAGFFTIVADRNPKAPGLEVADVGLPIDLYDYDRLLAAIEVHGGIDGVISMSEAGVRPAAYISDRLSLSSITTEAAEKATSKVAMRREWSTLTRYSPDYGVARTEREALDVCKRLAVFPLVFKPDRSFGGSRGVSRVEDLSGVREAFAFAKSGGIANGEVVIERFIVGTEHSAEVLIWEGQTSVLCIGQKVKSQYPYRVDISVQYPALLSSSQEAGVADMCRQAVNALGLTQGTAHIEFAFTADGPVLFELGARCGGGHTPQIAHHVSGVNEFIEACRMACGMPPAQFLPSSRRGADYRFLIFPPGKLAKVTIPDTLKSGRNILDVAVTLQPGEVVQPLKTTSERAGFVVTVASNRQAAVDSADWACREISVTYDDGAITHAYTLLDFGESAA